MWWNIIESDTKRDSISEEDAKDQIKWKLRIRVMVSKYPQRTGRRRRRLMRFTRDEKSKTKTTTALVCCCSCRLSLSLVRMDCSFGIGIACEILTVTLYYQIYKQE